MHLKLESKDIKFDICVMNPPYDNGLHEKFLEKSFDLSKQYIVSIEPINWLIGKKRNKNICELINKYGANIELINGNEFFDAGIGSNLSINFINLLSNNPIINYNGTLYKNANEIELTSNDLILSKFYKKISFNNGNFMKHIKCTSAFPIYSLQKQKELYPNKDWYILEIPTIRGHITKDKKGKLDDFYTILSNNDKFTNTKIMQYKDLPLTNKKYKWNDKEVLSLAYIAFDTINELKNCINYMKTDFFRICLYKNKTSTNILCGALNYIPWFNFNDPIFSGTISQINQKLYKKFNINQEEIQRIEEILPDYYGIRK